MVNRPTPRRSAPAADAAPLLPPFVAPKCAGMEEDAPMNRYISAPALLLSTAPPPCREERADPAERLLLEQLVELSAGQNQLLLDLVGAVNSLTAALLSQQLRL